jgi:hypothetical protein
MIIHSRFVPNQKRHTIKILMRLGTFSCGLFNCEFTQLSTFPSSRSISPTRQRERQTGGVKDDLIEIIHRCLCFAKDIERRRKNKQKIELQASDNKTEIENRNFVACVNATKGKYANSRL